MEHDKNFGAWHQKLHHAPILFIMLPYFPQKTYEKVGAWLKKLEHDKKNWSMTSKLTSCSKCFYHAPIFFIMLQIFLSCSNFFYHAPSFFTENVWKSGSMIEKIGAWKKFGSMTSNMTSCSNFFYHAPIIFTKNARKGGSMIKKIGAW